ncbi:MAG: hypothetical protein IJ352_06125 [Muribaculaceae bacterium]|nr:hypothetical protein [Muribaculaceae bacterium]
MKRIFYVAICAATSFAIISCGNTNTTETTLQQAETNAIDNAISDSIAKAKADSIAKIETMEKAKADSIARAKADSLEKINNPHPDLKLFDLRGPVKSCKTDEFHRNIYKNIVFTPDGSLSSISFKLFNQIHKDSNGFTTHLSGKFYDDDFEEWVKTKVIFVTNNAGKIAKLKKSFNGSIYYNGGDWEELYSYDSNGNLNTITTHGLTDGTETITFSYLEFDKYGNWTKRKFNGRYTQSPGTWGGTETRTITYYK